MPVEPVKSAVVGSSAMVRVPTSSGLGFGICSISARCAANQGLHQQGVALYTDIALPQERRAQLSHRRARVDCGQADQDDASHVDGSGSGEVP